jgi:hypothetical protein
MQILILRVYMPSGSRWQGIILVAIELLDLTARTTHTLLSQYWEYRYTFGNAGPIDSREVLTTTRSDTTLRLVISVTFAPQLYQSGSSSPPRLGPGRGVSVVTNDRCGSWIAISITPQHIKLFPLQRNGRLVRRHIDIQDCCMRVMVQMEMTLLMSDPILIVATDSLPSLQVRSKRCLVPT